MIGSGEWIVIVLVVVLLFGAGAIPKLARSLGKARAEFEKGMREGKAEARDEPGTEAKTE